MKKVQIFEPAMCCPTGLCGVGIDPELLRISTVLNTLEKSGYQVERFNLSSTPQAFVTNLVVNTYLREKGPEGLPVTVVDDEILITGRYPSNEELAGILSVPMSIFGALVDEKDTACCGGEEGSSCCDEEESCCCDTEEEQDCCGSEKTSDCCITEQPFGGCCC